MTPKESDGLEGGYNFTTIYMESKEKKKKRNERLVALFSKRKIDTFSRLHASYVFTQYRDAPVH